MTRRRKKLGAFTSNADLDKFKYRITKKQDGHVLRVYDGKLLIGSVGAITKGCDLPGYESHGNVVSAEILPEYRGRKLYQEMLLRLRKHLKDMGCKGLKSHGFQRSSMADRAWRKLNPRVVADQYRPTVSREDVLFLDGLGGSMKKHTVYRLRSIGTTVIPHDTGIESDLWWEGASRSEAERQARLAVEEGVKRVELWVFEAQTPFDPALGVKAWTKGSRRMSFERTASGKSKGKTDILGGLGKLPKKGRIPLAGIIEDLGLTLRLTDSEDNESDKRFEVVARTKDGKWAGHVNSSPCFEGTWSSIDVGEIREEFRKKGLYPEMLTALRDFVQSKGCKGIVSAGANRVSPDSSRSWASFAKREPRVRVSVSKWNPENPDYSFDGLKLKRKAPGYYTYKDKTGEEWSVEGSQENPDYGSGTIWRALDPLGVSDEVYYSKRDAVAALEARLKARGLSGLGGSMKTKKKVAPKKKAPAKKAAPKKTAAKKTAAPRGSKTDFTVGDKVRRKGNFPFQRSGVILSVGEGEDNSGRKKKSARVRWSGDKPDSFAYPYLFAELERLKGLGKLPKKGRIPLAVVKRAAAKLPKWTRKCGFTLTQLREGMEVEREHADVTRRGAFKTAQIAAAHLCEFKGGGYYPGLKQLERKLKRRK